MRRIGMLLAVPAAAGMALACGSDYGATDSLGQGDGGDASAQQPADASDGRADGADVGGFCSRRSGDAYCEDFDSLLDVKTLVPEMSGNGHVSLTQGGFVSPPRALSFDVSSTGVQEYAVFKHAVTGDRPVRLELDMYFDQLSDGEQTLQSITLSRKSGQVALARACGVPDAGVPSCSFFLAACLFNVDAGTNPCTSYWFPAIARPFAVGAWSHVALEATFAKEGHILFEAGGQPIVDVVTATHPGDPPSDAPTIVTVGVGVIQGTAQVHLLVDNVAITLR